MVKSFNILPLMINDHSKIEELIDKLDEVAKTDNYSNLVESFNKFEWELEKHIFTEEKAIFTDYNPENISEGYEMLPELTKQHNYIVNKLNNWRNDIKNHRNIEDVYGFKDFLERHRIFEEEKVYPKLDESLTEEQKSNIVAKINEIIQK